MREFRYVSQSCHSILVPPSLYQFDVYGAQGGTYSSGIGGKGGHSTGVIRFREMTRVFLCVGEAGKSTTVHYGGSPTSFGGGGAGGAYNYAPNNCGIGASGGGASDVRIGTNSLYHRAIVAGGGGGGGKMCRTFGCSTQAGGFGGGEKGGDGVKSSYYPNDPPVGGKGGTQNGGGSGSGIHSENSHQGCKSNIGSFGIGGSTTSGYCSGGGGGGGWFGGSSGQFVGASGGGGSGYIFNESTYSSTYNYIDKKFFVMKGHLESNKREGNGYIVMQMIELTKSKYSKPWTIFAIHILSICIESHLSYEL